MKKLSGVFLFIFLITMGTAQLLFSQVPQQQQPQNFGNPTNFPTPPRAMAFSQNPFENVNFRLCTLTPENPLNPKTQKMSTEFLKFASQIDKKRKDKYEKLLEAGMCEEDLSDLVPNSCNAFKSTVKMEDERTGTEKPVEKYDIKKLDALAATLKTKNQCKISKLDKAQKAADCFKNQYDILEKDLAKVEEDFSEYQDKAQKYATALENNIEEETQRGKTLEGKIEKYQAALKPLQELYDQMNEPVNSTESGAGAINNISTFRAALNDLSTIKQNKITNAIKKRKVKGTLTCMNSNVKGFSHIKNCTATSPLECIVENYRRERKLFYSGGNPRIDQSSEKKANHDTDRFKNNIDQMFIDYMKVKSDSSIDTFLAKNNKSMQRDYGNHWVILKNELRACFIEEEKDIKSELTMVFDKQTNQMVPQNPDTELGQAMKEYSDLVMRRSSEGTKLVNELEKGIRNASNAMFDQELNMYLNGRGCYTKNVNIKGDMTSQYTEIKNIQNCAEDLHANLYAMINGTQMPNANCNGGYIQGTTTPCPTLNVPLGVKMADGSSPTCKGLRDCMSVAQKKVGESQSRKTSLEGNGSWKGPCEGGQCPGKKRLYTEANAEVEKKFKDAASMFSQRAQSAKASLDQVREYFKNSGIEFPVLDESKIEAFKCTPKGDPESFCELPEGKEFGKKLADAAGLEMLDKNGFNAISKSVTEKKAELKKELKESTDKLNAKAEQCKKDITSEIQTSLSKKRMEVNSKLSKCTDEIGKSVKSLVEVQNDINMFKNNIRQTSIVRTPKADEYCSANTSDTTGCCQIISGESVFAEEGSSSAKPHIESCRSKISEFSRNMASYFENKLTDATTNNSLQNTGGNKLEELIASMQQICEASDSNVDCAPMIQDTQTDFENKCKNVTTSFAKEGDELKDSIEARAKNAASKVR